MTNPIREMIRARLLALQTSSEALEYISHDGTRGELREDYLVKFFADVIPSHLRIKKGLICDSRGNSTKQTDFIVHDPAILPSVTLSHNVGAIPIESVFMQAEIKSVIETKHLDQVAAQIKALHQLQIAHRGPESEASRIIVPTVLLGYSSKVAVETLKDWLADSENRPNLVAVCVVGKYSLFRTGAKHVTIARADKSDTLEPTLQFVHKLYDTLQDLATSRSTFVADWGQYLSMYKKP